MSFIRRLYYDRKTHEVLLWYSSASDTFVHTEVSQDLETYTLLSPYKDNPQNLGCMEWFAPDPEVERGFETACGVSVDASQDPPTLVFDFTPPEPELNPDERDTALLALGVDIAMPIQPQALAMRAAMDIAVSALPDEQVLGVAALCREWVIGEPVASGDIRCHGDKLFRCVQAHTTQADWTPDATPALWVRITANEWETWSPGSYPRGARVTHNGKRYESQVDNNHYEPGSPGVYDNVWKRMG